MLEYLLKSTACLTIFLIFYKILLEKERMHHFKRFYLVSTVIASFIIPAIVFINYIEVTPMAAPSGLSSVFDHGESFIPTTTKDARDMDMINWPLLLGCLYGIGFFGFGLRFFKNLKQILDRIRKNPKYKQKFIVKVLLQEKMPPHTFFRYVFLHKTSDEANAIPKEVLLHEEAHAKQYHSMDVMFIEFLQVILWFNPLIHFFKRLIKLNHEFLADQAVLDKEKHTAHYQNTLLSYLSLGKTENHQPVGIANAINYSSIKKRFTIMKKQTSRRAILFRSLLLFPMTALLLFGFSKTKNIQRQDDVSRIASSELAEQATPKELLHYNVLATKYNAFAIEQRKIPMANRRLLEGIYSKMNGTQREMSRPFPKYAQKNAQDGATKAQLAAYNTLAKKYNSMLARKGTIRIKSADVERLTYLHGIMNTEQRKNAEPFPDFPEPPPAPKAPNESEEALGTINHIVEEQDPYDVVGGDISINEPSKAPKSSVLPPPPPPPPGNAIQKRERVEVQEQLKKEKQELLHARMALKKSRAERVQASEESKQAKQKPLHAQKQMERVPRPPLPKSPIEHIREMAEKDALFYFEGKEIDAESAIEMLENNSKINIDTRNSSTKRPVVRMSTNPIAIEE